MPQVMSVRGSIDPEELGFTSMHEHVLCDCTVFFKRTEGKLPEDIPVKGTDLVSLENIDLHQSNISLTLDACGIKDETLMT